MAHWDDWFGLGINEQPTRTGKKYIATNLTVNHWKKSGRLRPLANFSITFFRINCGRRFTTQRGAKHKSRHGGPLPG